MWDTVQTGAHQLSHDMPCGQCGHPRHTFLACSDACACQPSAMPGVRDEQRFAVA